MAAMEELFMIDEAYEFAAPRFYDFMCGESEEDVRMAEQWLDKALPYAPSPLMHRIKATRTAQHLILCDFGIDKPVKKEHELSEKASTAPICDKKPAPQSQNLVTPQREVVISTETTEEVKTTMNSQPELTAAERTTENAGKNINNNSEVDRAVADAPVCSKENASVEDGKDATEINNLVQVCTPLPRMQTEDEKNTTAKKIASRIKNTSAMNSKNRSHKSQVKNIKATSVQRGTNVKNNVETPKLAHDNPAIKRQKLEGGKTRQILTINQYSNLPHKTKYGTLKNSSGFHSLPPKTDKEDRKIYVREPAVPFVSMAEITEVPNEHKRCVSVF